MTRSLSKKSWQFLLATAALSVALPLAVVGCSGGSSLPPPQPAPVSQASVPTQAPGETAPTRAEAPAPPGSESDPGP